MNLNVTESPRLKNGRHTVTITEINEGRSEYKDIPFFATRMESEDGFVEQRFYDSEPSQPIIAEPYASRRPGRHRTQHRRPRR